MYCVWVNLFVDCIVLEVLFFVGVVVELYVLWVIECCLGLVLFCMYLVIVLIDEFDYYECFKFFLFNVGYIFLVECWCEDVYFVDMIVV